jgi:LmbE family N-acetylglucosaminyl deacetylase
MPSVVALFAHPDDIEFVAAGTLALLRRKGWDVHLMNLANGCCGSTTTTRYETARIRLLESRAAAAHLQGIHYDPIFNDLEIEYTQSALIALVGILRRAKPSILLTHSPADYMEDHMQTCRLAVTAAFAKGVPNYPSPEDSRYVPAYFSDITIYHAQPHGNRTPLGEIVSPELAIGIDSVIDVKQSMLAEHRSQQAWLQDSQGMNSYVQTMLDLGREVIDIHATDRCEKRFAFAEGWRRHLHLGYSSQQVDPLRDVLSEFVV